MTKYCGSCGSSAADEALFCRVCGKKLREVPSKAKEVTTKDKEDLKNLENEVNELLKETEPNKVETSKEKQPSSDEIKEEPQKIPSDMDIETSIEQYLIREKLKEVEGKLKLAKTKIDEFLEKIEKDGESLGDEEVEELRNIILKIKNKRKELLEKKKPLPFNEEMAKKRGDLEEKIRKLKNKLHTKKITKLAYNKLKEEYEDKIKEYDRGINNKKDFEKKLRKKLILRKKELSESIEIFKGKLEIGEMTSEDFNNKKEKIEKDIEKVELVVNLLK